MPLAGFARFEIEIGRDHHPDNVWPSINGATPGSWRGEKGEREHHSWGSSRRQRGSSLSAFDSDDNNDNHSGTALSLRNNRQIRDNNRRQILPPPRSLMEKGDHDSRLSLQSRRTVQGESNRDTKRSLGPDLLGRRATEPSPPYRTVETLALPSNQTSSPSIAHHLGQADRDNNRSHESKNQRGRASALTDFMKSLHSRTQAGERRITTSEVPRRGDASRNQDSGNPDGRGDTLSGFMKSLSLGQPSCRAGGPRGRRVVPGRFKASGIVVTRKYHGRSRGRDHRRYDSSDSSSSSFSDSDYSSDSDGSVEIRKTYRPAGHGSSRRDDR